MEITNIKEVAKRFGILYDAIHKLYTYWLSLKQNVYKFKHRERIFSYGPENPDKTFYIIGVNHSSAGLFAIVKSVFCHIYYAVGKGYIPIVDMLNFKSQLSDKESNANTWELYFEQPCSYTLDDIRNSKNIIRSASLPYPKGVEIGFDTEIDENFYHKYHDSFLRYIRPCKSVKNYTRRKLDSIFNGNNKILGVLCRGTDYTENRPKGHPVQPSIKQALEKVNSLISNTDYEFIFLATEDKRYYESFKNSFGDKLIFSGEKLYEGMNGKKYLSEIPVANYSEKWNNIVDYYTTILILSKCNGLVAGLTCGSICAYLMSENYNYKFFWNLGRYN